MKLADYGLKKTLSEDEFNKELESVDENERSVTTKDYEAMKSTLEVLSIHTRYKMSSNTKYGEVVFLHSLLSNVNVFFLLQFKIVG